MGLLENVRCLANDLLSESEAGISLDRWILQSDGVLRSHQLTRDLFEIFSSNMLNTRGAGPNGFSFGRLISDAIERRWLTGTNSAPYISERELAAACIEIWTRPEQYTLAKTGRDYRSDLENIARGRDIGRAIIGRLLRGVSEFSEFLNTKYDGSAAVYHHSFSRVLNSGQEGDFLRLKLDEIIHITGIGIPVGMNFIKDSQAPSLHGQKLEDLQKNAISWFVKPDLHVIRLMYIATRKSKSETIEDVLNTPDATLNLEYARRDPVGAWQGVDYSGWPRKGDWYCIADMHHFARQNSVAPLEIDRLLYLIGSGKVRGREIRVRMKRYADFSNSVQDSILRPE